MLAVIRVFTIDNVNLISQHGRMITEEYGIPTRSYCIPDQPKGIYDAPSEAAAVPKIVTVAKQAQAEGAAAIFISCAADPGVTEVRRICSVPVIGAGSAAATLAVTLSSRIGVLTLNGPVPQVVADILGERMVAHTTPSGVNDTTDLLTAQGLEQAIIAAGRLVDQGADLIAFACTGFSTIGLADRLSERVGVKVIDAVKAGGWAASFLQNNLMRRKQDGS